MAPVDVRQLRRSAVADVLEMPLKILGVNHRTAPVELREKVAFNPDQLAEALRHLMTLPKVEEVVSVATIRDVFSKRFQTTGLDSPQEAHELALILRSGALAAPIEIVEERTIGPSLGQDNIDQGMISVMVGMALVLVFMAIYYRAFGIVADIALTVNLVLIVAILSMLQATLTLPGIAGIILTIPSVALFGVLINGKERTNYDDAGVLDNTIILFMADHGEMNGERALVDKGVYGHPKVMRVPLT